MDSVFFIVYKIYFLVSHRQKLRRCKDYFFGMEITILLKISVDNLIFELCDSTDYLVMKEKTIKFIRYF